ncbi:hypothetical protein M3Y97_00407900 [Aphelenchoides bicaudatus]|nr:hypothetical protein M3Y97_00407900 [Aphelenchoides bicaudatus]
MNQNFFNPSMPFRQPPPRAEVNWAMLAQRWASEHATNEPPYPNTGNNYSVNPAQNQSQYGSFFSTPPPNRQPVVFPPRLPSHGPPPIGLNQMMPPVPLPSYGNPYASNSWTNTANNDPPRPLFQSHANEVHKPNVQSNYDSADNQEMLEGVMPHWLYDSDVDDPAIINWVHMEGDWAGYDPNAVIDQQTRKKLPAWLLDGLEKAELQKKQNEEKEQKLAEQKLKEEKREKRRKDKGLGKFDTDSEDEEDGASSSIKPDSRQVGRKRKSREIDEKEFGDNKMAAIKRLVTNVLLESSDSAISELCHRVLNKAKSKAKPQLIAKSSGLTALNSIVGYDSSSEESDEE